MILTDAHTHTHTVNIVVGMQLSGRVLGLACAKVLDLIPGSLKIVHNCGVSQGVLIVLLVIEFSIGRVFFFTSYIICSISSLSVVSEKKSDHAPIPFPFLPTVASASVVWVYSHGPPRLALRLLIIGQQHIHVPLSI